MYMAAIYFEQVYLVQVFLLLFTYSPVQGFPMLELFALNMFDILQSDDFV